MSESNGVSVVMIGKCTAAEIASLHQSGALTSAEHLEAALARLLVIMQLETPQLSFNYSR